MDTKLVEEFINKCNEAYYKGYPFISDEAYDNLLKAVNFVDSDTVGHIVENGVQHYKRMYSLKTVYEGEKNKILSNYSTNELVCTPKLDGCAISILYLDGSLTRVLTRGNGKEGVDQTEKFLNSCIVPQSIQTDDIILQVTGEIVAPSYIENARNYASGSVNLISSDEFKTRAINFVAYDCCSESDNSHTYIEKLNHLSSLGFNTVIDKNLTDVYPIDGVVYRLNDLQECAKLGYTSKYPRFAYALKKKQDYHKSKLLNVTWATGRTGKVTPVAILEPIKIDGKEITKATLHNPGFIEGMDLRIGDIVGIRLAGMIIPEVVCKCDD